MKKIYIGTNWKMMMTTEEGVDYTKKVMELEEFLHDHIQLFVIPSYTSLASIHEVLKDSSILMGAQNMHWEEKGAFTGEISPRMLKETGVNVVELGHSERRQYFNEKDEDINKKVKAALHYAMTPLVCVGENWEEKESGLSVGTLRKQIETCLNGLSAEQVKNVWIAYEPVWAIGEKGKPASADYVADIHQEIRSILVQLFGTQAYDIPLLFGGSVNTENFLGYLRKDQVDGLFIGRAAWELASFEAILKEVNRLN